MEFIKNLPPELATFLLSMLPLTELRGSIPLAMAAFKMSPWQAFAYSLAGNAFISIVLIYILEPVTNFLRKHLKFIDDICKWLFKRTRHKYNKKMSELGHIALLIFVAIPLPGSGGWSGALIAHVFGVKKKLSVPIVLAGLIIAGTFVTFGTDFILSLFQP